jgi:hypothetical protein
MDTRFIGLTANSHYYDVKTGLPNKILKHNTKIMNKIIRLPGTVSMRDLQYDYTKKKQLFGQRKSHVEVA